MKTIRMSAMLLLAILSTSVVMATGNLKVNFTPVNSENAVVEISNVKSTKFEIEVKDQYGDLVFYKTTNENATDYKRMYNFSYLEDGVYTLSVKIDTETNKNKFKIDNGKFEFLSEIKIAKPYFTFEDNKFKMSYLNFNQDLVNLFVYKDSEKIMDKTIDRDFAINEGLDFSKSIRGNYRIVVDAGVDLFEYEIVKE